MIILLSQMIINNYYHKQKHYSMQNLTCLIWGKLNIVLVFTNLKDILEFNQSKYINDVLKTYGIENCKPISTPLELSFK